MHQLDPNAADDRRPPRWLLLTLLCAVILVRGRAMLAMSDSLTQDPDSYQVLASHLYYDGTFGWIRDRSGLEVTAFRPPLYPLLLAPFTPLAPVGLLHVILAAITVWAVWRLGLGWGLPPKAALLAAALVGVDPILIHQTTQVMTETLATCLAALALLAITRSASDGSVRTAALAGCLLGMCVLCRPTFLVWLVAVVIAVPLCASLGRRRAILMSSTMVLAAGLMLAPWAIRNLRQFGVPIITTTHGGYTLLLANNPDFYEYLRSGSWGSVWDAEKFNAEWRGEAEQRRGTGGVASIDEVDEDRRAYQAAFENIRREPLMFSYACLARIGRLWGVLPHQLSPDESPSRRGARYAVAVWYTLELLLAIIGVGILKSQLLVAPRIWGVLLLITFTAVHAFYWTDMRMRAPLMIVVALLAACAVATLARSRGGVNRSVGDV